MTDAELEKWKKNRIKVVQKHLRRMNYDELLDYFNEVSVQIVCAAADLGNTHWPAELHLGDVIEKQIMRQLQPA